MKEKRTMIMVRGSEDGNGIGDPKEKVKRQRNEEWKR